MLNNAFVLSKEEVRSMYRNLYQEHKNTAIKYFKQNGDLSLPEQVQAEIIKQLTRIVIIANTYMVNLQGALDELNPVLNQPLKLKKAVNKCTKKAKIYNHELKQTIHQGKLLRKREKPFFPALFQNGDIYVRISPLASTTARFEKILKSLNAILPDDEHLFLRTEEVKQQTKYWVKKRTSVQEQTGGRFLAQKLKLLDDFSQVLKTLPEETVQEFITLFSQKKTLTHIKNTEQGTQTINWVTQFAKKHNLPTSLKLDNALFYLIKNKIFKNTTKNDLLEVCQSIFSTLNALNTILNFEQTKQQKNKNDLSNPLNDDIDTIIFSIRPQQLAQMSAYVHWEAISCMSPHEPQHFYVKKDIGYGTLIAYGINSKNPQQKLVRLLLKPYKDAKGNVIYGPGRVHGILNYEFLEVVSQWSRKHFDNPQKGKLFIREPLLYADNQPEAICFFNNLEESCKYFKIPFRTEEINGKTYFIINGNFSSENMQAGFDFSNCIVLGDFYASGPDFNIQHLPAQAEKVYFNEVKLKKKVDLSRFSAAEIIRADLTEATHFIPPQNSLVVGKSKMPMNGVLDLSGTKTVRISGCSLLGLKSFIPPQKELKIQHSRGATLEVMDLSSLNKVDLTGTNLNGVKKIIPPKTEFILNSAVLPNTKSIDFSGCQSVSADNTDMSHYQEIILPSLSFSTNKTKFGNLDTLDLSHLNRINISGADLSNVQHLILPTHHTHLDLYKTILPAMDILDMHTFKTVSLGSTNLSQVKKIIPPTDELTMHKCIIGALKSLDLSNCKTVIINNINLKNIQEIIPPSKDLRIEYAFIPSCRKLDFSNTQSVSLRETDIWGVEELIPPQKTFDLTKTTLSIKNLDLSGCQLAILNQTNLIQTETIKFPRYKVTINNVSFPACTHIDLSTCSYAQMENVNLSAGEVLIAPQKEFELTNVTLPANVDFSTCSKVEGKQVSIIVTRELKSPMKNFELKHSSVLNLSTLDISGCEKANFSYTDLRTVQHFIPPLKELDLYYAKLPETTILDLSGCNRVYFGNLNNPNITFASSVDTSITHNNQIIIIVPKKKIKIEESTLKGNIDLSSCEKAEIINADFRDGGLFIPPWKYLSIQKVFWNCEELDLSACQKVELAKNSFLNMKKLTLPTTTQIKDMQPISPQIVVVSSQNKIMQKIKNYLKKKEHY